MSYSYNPRIDITSCDPPFEWSVVPENSRAADTLLLHCLVVGPSTTALLSVHLRDISRLKEINSSSVSSETLANKSPGNTEIELSIKLITRYEFVATLLITLRGSTHNLYANFLGELVGNDDRFLNAKVPARSRLL